MIDEELQTWHEPKLATAFLRKWSLTKHADVAATILRVMRARSLMVDSYHYSSALSACSKAGHWMLAVQLLLDMDTYKLEKTRVVYTGAISAFATSGHWQFALLMLEEVRFKLTANLIWQNFHRICLGSGFVLCVSW